MSFKLSNLIAAICILLFLFISHVNAVGMITPTRYPRVSTLAKDLKSVYTIYFKVDTTIADSNYIKIEFSDYASVTPDRCAISLNSVNNFIDSECSTIGVSNILYIKLPAELNASFSESVLQIDLQNNNPISSQSKSIQIWTVSAQHATNFFIYDQNFNFGQIPFTPESTEELQVQLISFGLPATLNTPSSTNTLKFAIQINEQVGDSDLQSARIKVVLSSPWKFLNSAQVTAEKDPRYDILNPLGNVKGKYLDANLYKAPTISSIEIETPTQMSIVFGEDFKPGRSFIIQITNIQNPPTQATGKVKVYSMNYNSNIVLEKNENLIDLQIFYHKITTSIAPPSGVPFVGPVGFYKNTKQFIRIKFQTDFNVPAGYTLKIDFGANNAVIQGTAFIDSQITPNDSTKPITYKYSGSSFTVENISALTANTEYYAQIRIKISKVDANIKAKVSLDANPTTLTPLFYGETALTDLKSDAKSIQTSIKGNANTDGYVDVHQTPGQSKLIVAMTIQAIDTENSSILEIYTNKHLVGVVFNGNSCFLAGPVNFSACTLTTSATHTVIRIESGAAFNRFTGSIVLTVQELNFDAASNNEDATFEFNFRLFKNSNANSPFIDWISTPIVKQDAETNFQNIIMSDLYQVNDYIFPSIINLVSQQTTNFNYAISGNQKRVITIWAQSTFKNLIYQPKSQESFSCGSNLLSVQCEYVEGDPDKELANFISWDHVNIILPDSAATQKFHVIIPDLLQDTSNTYRYRVGFGIYDTGLRTYRYLKHQNEYSKTNTYLLAFLTNNQQRLMSIDLAGNAGSSISDVTFVADTKFNSDQTKNTGNDYGAGIITITDWELWIQGVSQYKATPPVQFSNTDDENAPVTCSYFDINNVQHFITVFPLVGIGQTQFNVNLILNNILLPFSYDIPNYNLYMTNNVGRIKGFSQFFNTGSNVFYQNTLPSLDITCDDFQEGILNTRCTLEFLNLYNIQKNAQIYVNYVGLKVFTNECTVQYESAPTVWTQLKSATCLMNLDADQMVLTLNEASLLPKNKKYQISFYGMEIQNVLVKYFVLSVRDKSGRFVIEDKTKQVTTQVFEPQYIQITEITYDEINPYVFSSLKVKFTTPRILYPNEEVALDMGTDLNDVNTNTDRLSVQLFRISNNEEIRIAVNFVQQKINILFFDRTKFTADNYRLEIHNIRNPSTNANDYFKIQFVRNYDKTLVLQNTQATTSAFPSFIQRTNSDIKLESANYLQEGALQELTFKITMQDSKVDSKTKIVINFPLYYSPAITNFSDLLSCTVNNISIECSKDPSAPYRLIVKNSPLSLHQGEQFTLTIFGIITPKKTIRDDAKYTQETLFLGVDTGTGDNFYREFIHLPPPQVTAGLNTNYLYLQHVNVSVKYSGSLSSHSLKFYTDGVIPASQGILVVFPKQYSTLIITKQLNCLVKIENGTSTAKAPCQIDGRTIKMTTGDSIPAKSYFFIDIDDVPTPPTDGSIDYNDIIIQVFDPTTKNIVTRNFYLTNRMSAATFQKLNNVLKINNDQIISVVKGTTSKEIVITTPDNTRYITNLQIDTSATGFTFNPKQLNVFLGDFQTKFKIGADKNLQEKAYQFTINMEEKYFKRYYSVQNTYVIFVISTPLQVTIPASVNVPIGGCSLPEKIRVDNNPQDDVEISIQYDYNQYPEKVFVMDLELSSYVLKYNSTFAYRYASFCISDSYKHPTSRLRQLQSSTMKVGLHLGGQNSASYQLQNSEIILNISTLSEIQPSLQLTQNTVKRTSFLADISVPTDGVLYWHLYVNGTANNLDLNQIKFFVKYQNETLQASQNAQDNVLGIKVDERVGLQVLSSSNKPHQITLNDLQPETDYVLCGYFENQFKTATQEQTCIKFLTLEWEVFTKVTISFTKKTYEDMMNDILCFYVREVKTRIFNIINAGSTSCSFGVSPSYYYYKYKGLTYSKEEDATNIYLIPDLLLETDTALDTLKNFYEATNLLKQSIIDTAKNSFQIDFIKEGSYIQQFKYVTATSAQGDFTIPSISSIDFISNVTITEASITAKIAKLSKDGVVYFILDRAYQLEWDPMKEKFQKFPVNIIKKPKPSQIVECKNAFDTPAQKCIRAVITNGQSVDALFADLLFESEYVIYYVVANEYPLRPILSEEVKTSQVQIGFKPNKNSDNILALPSMILFAILLSLYFI